MPKIVIYGKHVRVRPMLDAIGAQDDLAAHAAGTEASAMQGARAAVAFERKRSALARRRNAAEAKLRPEEHAAWESYRRADETTRAAIWAMLTDLPH